MDKAEIDATLAQAETQVLKGFAAAPAASWFLTLVSPLLLLTHISVLPMFFEVAFLLLSLFTTLDFRQALEGFKRRRASVLWTKLRSQPRFFEQLPAPSRELSTQIGAIYQQDPTGEFFPPSQALRLLDTHHSQQQRAHLVSARLVELETLQATLSGKIKQLRELGANSEDGEANLRQIEADTAALKTLKSQIEASCRRLEMILISVETAFKTRQLQREISELGSRATQPSSLSALAPENELSDIERQIGREIETFLQLERETERHFS